MKRLAILGCWNPYHALDFVKELRSLPGAELSAVWDDDPIRCESFCAQHGIAFEADLDRLLANDMLDGVIICASVNKSAPLAGTAAAAGKPVFCDHLLSASLHAAVEASKRIEASGILFGMDLPLTYWPVNLAAIQAVQSGRLGPLTALRIRNAHDGAIGGLPAALPDADYGVGADLGAHGLYLMTWLMGTRAASVYAAHGRYSGSPFPDNAAYVFEFANGAVAVLESSWVARRSPFSIEVYGTKGAYLGRGATGKHHRLLLASDAIVQCHTDEPWEPAVPAAACESNLSLWLKKLAGEASDKPLAGLAEGLELARLLEAIRLSAASGRKVFLDELDGAG